MNAAQIHLALNHAPLFLSLFAGGTLILGMIQKNEMFKTLSLYLLVAAALFTVPVFLTGEGTEELVEHLPGVTENIIEKHEEMAKIALIVIAVSGVVALAGLFLRKKASMARTLYALCLLFSLASFGTMARTAHLGGLIRHSELQAGNPGTDANGNKDKGDDDIKDKEDDD